MYKFFSDDLNIDTKKLQCLKNYISIEESDLIKSEKSIFGGISFIATHFNVEGYHIDKCLTTVNLPQHVI